MCLSGNIFSAQMLSMHAPTHGHASTVHSIRPLLVAYLFQMRILARPDEGAEGGLHYSLSHYLMTSYPVFLTDENTQKDGV